MKIMENCNNWISNWMMLILVIVFFRKPIQFVIFLLVSGILIIGMKKYYFDKVTLFLLVYAATHFFSIAYNYLVEPHDMSRVFAAINSAAIWVLAVGLYYYYKFIKFSIAKLSKVYFITCQILFLFLVYSLVEVYLLNKEVVILFGNVLMEYQNFEIHTVSRFAGGLEYPTLLFAFLALLMPIALICLNSVKYKNILTFLFFCEMGLVVFFSRSRSGWVLYAVFVLAYYFNVFHKQISNSLNNRRIRIALVLCCFISFIALFFVLRYFYNYHPGSNASRSIIYRESIQAFLKHPIIGCGIKEYASVQFPLGSHSSYIGFLYKTGIVGTLIVILSLLNIFVRLMKWCGKIACNTNYFMLAVSLLLMFVFMIFEDIDGSNWLICLWMTELGIAESMYGDDVNGVCTSDYIGN